MVEGDASAYYYLDGALDCECTESQPIRDDVLSNFYPEAWELSPKDTAGLPMSYKLGPRWDSAITWSNFKSEAIFGFLSPNYTWKST